MITTTDDERSIIRNLRNIKERVTKNVIMTIISTNGVLIIVYKKRPHLRFKGNTFSETRTVLLLKNIYMFFFNCTS